MAEELRITQESTNFGAKMRTVWINETRQNAGVT